MSQVNLWTCMYRDCTSELNEVEHHWNCKYCKACQYKISQKKWHDSYLRRKKDCKPQKRKMMLYLLKTNKILSLGQIKAFTEIINNRTVSAHVCHLRSQGHRIKYRVGFYYYEGKVI